MKNRSGTLIKPQATGDERAGAMLRPQGWRRSSGRIPTDTRCRKRKARRGLPHRNSGLPDLRTHKKTDLGQARNRRAIREFQFHECTDLRSRVKRSGVARTRRAQSLYCAAWRGCWPNKAIAPYELRPNFAGVAFSDRGSLRRFSSRL
jgi:hypothetical protein